MREEGTAFFATSYALDRNRTTGVTEATTSWYGEYGHRENLTFGISGWSGSTVSSGTAFFRYPLPSNTEARKASIEFGVGLYKTAGQSAKTSVKLGLSFGRGIPTRWGNGWVQLALSAEKRKWAPRILKADLTLGLSPNSNNKIILDIQSEKDGNKLTTITLAPSYVRKISEKTHLVIGLNHGVRGKTTTGLRLGTWISF